MTANLKRIVRRIIETAQTVTDTFTHDGVDYDTQKLINLTQGRRVIPTNVSELIWVLNHDTPSAMGVRNADVSVPVIVTMWKGKKAVIDGLHRLQKAVSKGLNQLPAVYATQKDLDQCRV